MLNSKQRAYLRGLSNKIDPIFQIGKGGVSPELVVAIDEALEARELIKCTVLNNCMDDIKYIASAISERTKSDIVQIIGKKIVVYRESKEKPIIVLPK
ncbi:ribosome assembly RNA-binding protein YhbY [[Clostridium] colinum]|uniref:ribosome assembly RNA-binding protein YhbY n=1 Tax=[Clostridium] colinum TaxID=36835 RepID=UPI002025766F|nr:ribosome assembly RNA-binding protein YhbY [[Clostridium] colinum]